MDQYLIWNPAKVANNDGCADTYEELLQTEEEQGYSSSSIITTDDIEAIVTAIQNECDADILYKKV